MNLIEQYHPIYTEKEAKAVYDLINSGSWLSEFKQTEKFETELAKICEAPYVSCVNNGTIALSLALMAKSEHGFQPEEKVLIPNLTMIATATAVQFIGGLLEFCDIDETGCMDCNKAIKMLENDKSIKNVIYVTLNGRFNNYEFSLLKEYCETNNIWLIKDDAQSLGSRTSEGLSLQNEKYGQIHTISFSPHKLVSCGQGGAIVTHSKELYERVERLKDFGRLNGIGGDKHDYFGINSKFTEIQATLGLCQLEDVNSKISKKKHIYELYFVNLKELTPNCLMFENHLNEVPWFVDIYVKERTSLIKYLKDNNIQTRPMYPVLTSQLIYKNDEEYLFAQARANTGLWLPSSLDIKDEEILYICGKIKEFYK